MPQAYQKQINKLKIEHPYGPAMSSLTPLQQRFVEALIVAPLVPPFNSMRTAGYKGTPDACHKATKRALARTDVLEAIKEASAAKMRAMLPKAVEALDGVLENPKHRDHLKAVTVIMDRAGLHEIKESKKTIEHTINTPVMIAKIKAMAEMLGVQPGKLLPSLRTNQLLSSGDTVIAIPEPSE
jgi:phage terminase small subunit